LLAKWSICQAQICVSKALQTALNFGAKRALEKRNLRAGKKRKKNWNFWKLSLREKKK
jgi:hypothetical protein